MLPKSNKIDAAIMLNTFNLVWKDWSWKETWGWDFPMTAMTATRLGLPEKAIDALMMDITTNTYLANGHNYQDNRLRLYLPGNGGLLTAIAMMVTGYDGAKQTMPGIPKNGKWKVRYEGLKKMP
jgi:protein-glucosylgalactosylhydroxylysine glucosidase